MQLRSNQLWESAGKTYKTTKRKALVVWKVARSATTLSTKMMIIQRTMSKSNSKTFEENTGVAQVLKAATINTKTEIWEVIQATEEGVVEVGHKKSLADRVTRVTINSKTDNTNLQQ